MPETVNRDELYREAELLIRSDPLRFTLFNPAQIRAIKALRYPDLAVLVLVMGNGTGKTFGLHAIESAIMFGTKNPLFDTPLVKHWPYPKSARLCAPPKLLEDRGPIQRAIEQLFPKNAYTQSRGVGKGYYSDGETSKTGWDWDFMSYNQNPREAAGFTKGLVCFTEPPPFDFFVEVVSRTRGQGLVVIECTPLNYAPWIKEELVDPGFLQLDGKKVGRVVTVYGEIWDNCDEHEGGQLSREAIERQIALWPAEEREARTKGVFLHLAGRIYSKWGDSNELQNLPDYHRECWEMGRFNLVQIQDPHDRKPWFIAWFAVFPNNDVIAVAEWPPFSFKDTPNSPVFDPEEYRDIIHEAESELGYVSDTRIEDPNFSMAPLMAAGGKSLKDVLASNCRRCPPPTCPHSLYFIDPPDSLAEGHMLVRRAIGEVEKGLRPKAYALKDACPNLCYSMRHYGYRENKPSSAWKGPSERPELINKDGADLFRYGYLSGCFEYRRPSEPIKIELKNYGIRKNKIISS